MALDVCLFRRVTVATLWVSRWLVAAAVLASVLFSLFLAVFVASACARHFGVPPLILVAPLVGAGILFAVWAVREIKRLREIHDATSGDEMSSSGRDDQQT
jgi:hypothetical protein